MSDDLHLLPERIELSDPIAHTPLATLVPAVSTRVRALTVSDALMPIRSIHETDPVPIFWDELEQDEDGQHVYLYRELYASHGSDSYHLSVAARTQTLTLADLIPLFGTNHLPTIIAIATGGTGSYSPVLHTSQSRQTALGFVGGYGELIRYKIPKAYIAAHSDRFFRTHVGESEISVLFGLPPEFVDEIESFDEGRLPDIEGIASPPAEIRLEI